jgi:predicted Fe-Mo cluster-binding NifX family protein
MIMRIAVASQNFRTITRHAGVTRRFLVYVAERGEPPREVARLDLPRELAMREVARTAPHPLDAVDVVLVGSAGPGFLRRMEERGVVAVVTSETDPLGAVAHYLGGTLTTAPADSTSTGDDDSPCYGVRLRARRRTGKKAC